MKELIIYEYQAKEIEDTLRLCANTLESYSCSTFLDRNVMQSWQMIKNVLLGDPNLLAPYHLSNPKNEK